MFFRSFLTKFLSFNYNQNIWFLNEFVFSKLTVKNVKINFFNYFFSLFMWLKARFSYYLNNWVYTTNHKRIAINYFWFVILSGIFGLVLATLIRLEMAYPGAGILAGDSLQYLSIVTAHGVIMVFFMIIPLLFGAYSNFLLPTQLGVHDVAFPRLNSAAFWFLPGGLIMLGQLVCVDRRYQRMNCFNVREYESLLKRKFFFDLINTSDYRTLLHKTNINLKYKFDNLNLSNSNINIFDNFGLTNKQSERLFSLQNKTLKNYLIFDYNLFFNVNNINLFLNFSLYKDFLVYFFSFNFLSYLNYVYLNIFSLNFLSNLIFKVSDFFNPRLDFFIYNFKPFTLINQKLNLSYLNLSSLNLDKFIILNTQENLNNHRSLKNNNPVFKFDFKSGVYINDDTLVKHQHLIPTYSFSVKTGKSKSNWFISDEFNELFFNYINDYLSNLISSDFNKSNIYFKKLIHNSNYDVFLFFYNFLKSNQNFFNFKRFSFLSLNQKFESMFLNSNSQQRVFNNWRSLKFTREAWRSKLLISRHQKSMYRRYVNNDSLFWSIERNAKDLLPGWDMVTPFSSRTRYTLIGKTDIGLFGVFLSITSSMINSINFLITYRYLSTLNNRKMRDARAFFTEGIIVASWMIVSANPMLGLAILMLISDRHWRTSFFDYSGGGDAVLFQHMFWFFGHPEVYIIMIPCFGFVNTIIAYYLRKRISARSSLIYSMYTIAFLGFFVWGHHMYMVGLAHTTRMLYSTLTVMISVPAATKLMHWFVTFVNGTLHFELPLLFTIVFIFLFLSGGISGMAVAHTGMDVLFHDTLYVVAHFHVMLAGAAIGMGWAAFYFYFPALFGVKFSRIFAYLHFFYYYIGHLITFIPLLWLGYAGMPRRVLDYPLALAGWHSLASAGHLLSIAGIVCFFIMLFDSIRRGKASIRNTFGVGRYNTRLNFYNYEISKLTYLRGRSYALFPYNSLNYLTLNKLYYINFESYESTLFFYKFENKKVLNI